MVNSLQFRTLTALGVVATAVASAEYFEGDGTAYTLSEVSSGNCNFMSAISIASTNYAALNNDQWDDLANCGRCAEVSCIDDQCEDQTTTAIVQILDRCPECSSGDLDLSPTVFKIITGSDPSRLTIRWQFVDCPSPGTVEVCLMEGSNTNWVAVQPTNMLVGVESLTINGETPTMLDGAYYYVLESSSGVDLTAVEVSITSIDGDVIDGTYALTAGSCTDMNQQFGGSNSTTSGSSTTTTAPAATTATPVSTTATPTATTATPTATTATPTASAATPTASTETQGSSAADDADGSSEEDATTTTAPATATTAPATTTTAPTTAPVATTATPVATTAAPSGSDADTSKCHVRGRRHRN
ncbi:hypothetical protein BBJ28_00001032 [Nothophytophthora sp. Chile5]|nr:hypothetical protein BBJ28_00001032 [Nothophytophthora sp. Chile5]